MKKYSVLITVALATLSFACGQHGHHPKAGHAQHGEHPHKHKDGHHRFDDAEHWAKVFDAPERAEWQKPDEVVQALGLGKDAVIVDIGSGTGYFAVRFAKAAPEGKVYGADIEASMSDYLNTRAMQEGLENLQAFICPPDDAALPEPVDVVFVADTYHHISDRVDYLKKLVPNLKPGARVVIVDFKKGELPMGPPDSMKLSAQEVEAEFQAAGFVLKKSHDFLPYQYFLEFGVVE